MKIKQFKYHKFILLIIFFLFINAAYTKTVKINKIGRVKSDNSWIKIRMPSEKRIKYFKSKNDFQYHEENKLQGVFKNLNQLKAGQVVEVENFQI